MASLNVPKYFSNTSLCPCSLPTLVNAFLNALALATSPFPSMLGAT